MIVLTTTGTFFIEIPQSRLSETVKIETDGTTINPMQLKPVPHLYFTLPLDPSSPPCFDGTLSLFKGSTLIATWKACSGITSKPKEYLKEEYGPIPPGQWKIEAESSMSDGRPGYHLQPFWVPDFDNRKLDSFWIHGDNNSKTLGCIGLFAHHNTNPPFSDEDYKNFSDTLKSDEDVKNAIANGYFFLYVEYPTEIRAYCYKEKKEIHVSIIMDGLYSGDTPHTFWLAGLHTVEVPKIDFNGHKFSKWNTGSRSVSISNVRPGWKYIAYYGLRFGAGGGGSKLK